MENKINMGRGRMKEILKKIKLEMFGEYISYLYIISAFINSKLNMKLGYLLMALGILKLLFLKEKANINKKVYGMFSFLFVLGIISNLIVSKTNGVNVFINENGRFFYAAFLSVFLSGKDKLKKIDISINTGVILLCIGILMRNEWFMKGSYSRQRGILIIGIVYIMINFLECILKEKYKNFYILPLILSLYSIVELDSRMAVFVILICLGLYLLFILFFRKDYKIKKLLLILILGGILGYNLLPNSFVERVKTSFHTSNNVSNEDRIVMWKAGAHIFKENYLLGVGTSEKDIKPLLIKYVEKNIEKKVLRNEFIRDRKFSRLHNMYVDFFVQNGTIGIFYIGLLFIIIPYEFHKSKKNTMETALFFSIIGFYIYGITWSIWSDYGSVQMLFQIMLALMLTVKENEEKRES